MNKNTTPGPPLKHASPRLLKLHAPIIAAIPKKVKRQNTDFDLWVPRYSPYLSALTDFYLIFPECLKKIVKFFEIWGYHYFFLQFTNKTLL